MILLNIYRLEWGTCKDEFESEKVCATVLDA
jgi:hypothetical protein